MNAWAYRELAEVSYFTAFGTAIVALLYYFAATQVFPKAADTETLDAHIMAHRREVAFCVLASNLLTQIPPAIEAYTAPWPLSNFLIWSSLNLTYYVLLSTAALAKSKRVVIAALVTAIVFITTATLVFA